MSFEYCNEISEMTSQGRYDDARVFAQSLITAMPDDFEGWNHRVEIEMSAKNYETALDYARETIRVFPGEANPRVHEIMILWDMKQKKEAIRLRKIFEKDFAHDKAGVAVVSMLEAMKRLKPLKAIRSYREIQKHTDELDSFDKDIAQIEHYSGNFGAAQRSLIEAYQRDPYDAEICADLAENYRMCFKLTKAREMARHVQNIDPSRHGKMTRVIWLTYLTYFPPCWNVAVIWTALEEAVARSHWMLAFAGFYVFRKLLGLPILLFFTIAKFYGLQSLIWSAYGSVAIYLLLYASLHYEWLGRWIDSLIGDRREPA